MRLRRVEPYGPGFTRRRSGRGFSYVDDHGNVCRDAGFKERVKELVIPPAWHEVWICADPAGHIQAVGFDDAGRRQYLYHPEWREQRDLAKHDRVLELAACLPVFRRKVSGDLQGRGATRTRVLAAALRCATPTSTRGWWRPGRTGARPARAPGRPRSGACWRRRAPERTRTSPASRSPATVTLRVARARWTAGAAAIP
ncbi:hypothetical protein AB0I28_13095 [Phytomonospora sp. NPDC050363]|uniref:hypothetical protein n=1 Tax=Phytomonospora sp. NPDC050363 TaxID=3155642 RepID=UPI0033E79C02